MNQMEYDLIFKGHGNCGSIMALKSRKEKKRDDTFSFSVSFFSISLKITQSQIHCSAAWFVF